MRDRDRMSTWVAIIVAIGALAGEGMAANPPLCTSGRFAVDGAPLIGPGGEIVVLQDRTIAIGDLCAAKRAKLKRTKAGTKVRVKFAKDGCTGVTEKVKLSALIFNDCAFLDGTLKIGGGA